MKRESRFKDGGSNILVLNNYLTQSQSVKMVIFYCLFLTLQYMH